MSEHLRQANYDVLRYEIGSDPVIDELKRDASELHDQLMIGCDINEIDKEIMKLNARYGGLLGHCVSVKGAVYLEDVHETAEVWDTGLSLSYNGIGRVREISEDGVGSRIKYTFVYPSYDCEGNETLAHASAPLDSFLLFQDVASKEHLEKIYDLLGDPRYTLHQISEKIDDIIVEYCEDMPTLLDELSRLDFRELAHVGVNAFHAVTNHLNDIILPSLPSCYLNSTAIYDTSSSTYAQIIASDQDCLFSPTSFEFSSAFGESESEKVPILSLVGTVSSRRANVLNYPVKLPLIGIDIQTFIETAIS